jgi:hypothetical protein
MNEAIIREAVSFLQDYVTHYKERGYSDGVYLKFIRVLLSLAEAWLARKWPEKKTLINIGKFNNKDIYYHNGWNDAIDACRLASVVSEEEIEKILTEYDAGHNYPIPKNEYAHAIAAHINQKGEGNV